jgi:hypothetical protein
VEDLVPVVIWIIILAGIAFAIFAAGSQQAKAMHETYRRVAQLYDGRLTHGGGLFSKPSLTFVHRGAPVQVDVYTTGGKNSRSYTQVHLVWPDRTMRCEVYPERFTSRLGKLLGMTDVEIGSPEFDRDFIITGASPRHLRELLTPPVQRAIYRLRQMLRNDDIYVSIGRGRMLVKKLGMIRDQAQLAEYISAALDLYDCATGIGPQEMEFMEQAAEATTEVVCQVCGETIVAELVHCRRCQTPHHEDCWQYFGGCSTFGCGEKRYIHHKS